MSALCGAEPAPPPRRCRDNVSRARPRARQSSWERRCPRGAALGSRGNAVALNGCVAMGATWQQCAHFAMGWTVTDGAAAFSKHLVCCGAPLRGLLVVLVNRALTITVAQPCFPAPAPAP
eukprot:2175537-Pyramimonas_sp.AAC.1